MKSLNLQIKNEPNHLTVNRIERGAVIRTLVIEFDPAVPRIKGTCLPEGTVRSIIIQLNGQTTSYCAEGQIRLKDEVVMVLTSCLG